MKTDMPDPPDGWITANTAAELAARLPAKAMWWDGYKWWIFTCIATTKTHALGMRVKYGALEVNVIHKLPVAVWLNSEGLEPPPLP